MIGVGKTSLINKFIHKETIGESDAYNTPGNSTIGACFFTCNMNLPDARVIFQVRNKKNTKKVFSTKQIFL